MDYRSLNDDELIYLYHCHDSFALLQLLRKYQIIMPTWIQALSNRFPRYLVDYQDCQQTASLILLESLDGYRNEKGNYYSYLQLKINQNFVKKIREQYNFEPGVYVYSLDDYPKSTDGLGYIDLMESSNYYAYPKNNYDLQETMDLAFLKNSSLTEIERNVAAMKALGYSYEEIMEKHGITYKRVSYLLSVVKEKVAKYYQKDI